MNTENKTTSTELSKESYMAIKAKIQQRRRQLYVHSYLYYKLDAAYIDDHTYDRWSRELIRLQNDYPEISKEADFYEDFKNFTPGSSFAIPHTQEWIPKKAEQLLKYNAKLNQEGTK